MRRIVMVVCLGLALACAGPAQPAAAAQPYVRDLGLGMAAIGTNFFYIPAKMIYATGGGIVGLLGYGLTLGNLEAAQNIWSPTVGGTWVVTPDMMSGQKPILFSGESYEPQRERVGADER